MKVVFINTITSLFRRTAVTGCLLFSFSIVQAQYDTVIVDETEQSTDEGKGDGDTDDQTSFFVDKNTYDTVSFRSRAIPADALKKMKEDKDFWYADGSAQPGKRMEQPSRQVDSGSLKPGERIEQEEPYVPVGKRSWFQTLMWIVIIGGFAAAIMWYLAGSNVGLFRKKERQHAAEEESEISEDIFSINYQKEIDKAAAQGNYRLAIRLMYLRLLKNLSEKNIIRYKQDRTNLDYLMQLHPTAYYKDFFRITRNYEYSWYGQFNVSNEAYGIIKNEFDVFEKTTS